MGGDVSQGQEIVILKKLENGFQNVVLPPLIVFGLDGFAVIPFGHVEGNGNCGVKELVEPHGVGSWFGLIAVTRDGMGFRPLPEQLCVRLSVIFDDLP